MVQTLLIELIRFLCFCFARLGNLKSINKDDSIYKLPISYLINLFIQQTFINGLLCTCYADSNVSKGKKKNL